MNASFDPDILASFDLSLWTPVAERKRPGAGVEVARRSWKQLEGAPFGEETARAGRDAGYLLTALQCEADAEVLLVKLSEQASQAVAKPAPPRRPRRRHWYD
jgi:hypothetical protein